MKKILFLIFIFFLSINITQAKNHIYNIDISVYLDEEGNASITEVWKVKGSDGTEWYKVLGNLGNSKISDFKVSMDGNPLIYKNWNVNESLSAKKGYYGINNGNELCFGKYDYKKHTFTLSYTLSNFVFNVSDSQVIYFNFIDRLSDVNFDDFTLELSSYYSFPDTLDVWGYGYKGYAYVENGKIKMSNESDMDDKYVVMLAKFPLNTFNTINSSKYNNFNEVLTKAEEGSFEYVYIDGGIFVKILTFIFNIISYIPVILPFILIIASISNNKSYGYKDNKKINKKEILYFRDIPCNKDIYYANTLARINNFGVKETNIFGAIFLKWIKQGKITVSSKDKIFNKKETNFILNKDIVLEDELETKLFDYIYEASSDGILEANELERWARNNYSKFLNLFENINTKEIDKLQEQGHIYVRNNKNECKYKNVMDDTLYEEAKKLYGLKLFLEHFSNIKEREAIEVNLWDEYLMFAYIFGIADKVAKQFKNLYPEVITMMQEDSYTSDFDFDTFIFINNISKNSSFAASNARSAARSYSSGGGGFSRGGGGGGSFGGGGGGSR